MRHMKIGLWLVVLAIVFNLVFHTYFGWGYHPRTIGEQRCEFWYYAAFGVGWLIYFLPGIHLYRAAVIKHETKPRTIDAAEAWQNWCNMDTTEYDTWLHEKLTGKI